MSTNPIARFVAALGRAQSRVLCVWRPAGWLVVAIEWKAADLWIGGYIYTRQPTGIAPEEVNIYLILIPTLVLHIAWLHKEDL